MSALNPITLLDAARIMAPKLGKQWPLSRTEVVAAVNRARLLFYDILQPASAFSDISFRVRPSTFSHSPGGRYVGFTLPREVDSLTGVWLCSEPLRVSSSWREAYEGIPPGVNCIGDVISAGNVPTERSLIKVSKLRAFSDGENTGAITLRGYTHGNRRIASSLPLQSNDWFASADEFTNLENVVLPVLKNRVILTDDDGYELSHYYPGEGVPSYAHYRCPRSSNSYIISCTRKYVEIACDTQVVELGDRLILEAAATGLRYEHSKDASEQRLSSKAFSEMRERLGKVLERTRGIEKRGPVITRRKRPTLYRTRPY